MTEGNNRQIALQRASSVAGLIQGEVLALPDICLRVGDSAAPLSDEVAAQAAEAGISSGFVVAGVPCDEVVLLTQTCDLQQTSVEEATCLVAPVRQARPQLAREALRGRRPHLAALPWRSESCVVDLSQITTVERCVLVDAASLGKPRTPGERQHFAESVARYLTRPALADEINEILRPLFERIKERHDRNSPEGECLSRVAEFRIESTPDLDADCPALTVLVVLGSEDLPALANGVELNDQRIDDLISAGIQHSAEAVISASSPRGSREAWQALAENWLEPSRVQASAVGFCGSLEIAVLNDQELSYARSRAAPILDLRYLSTRRAAGQPARRPSSAG